MKEIIYYKNKNALIKSIGFEEFEIELEDKNEFPLPFKARRNNLFWQIFDNELINDGHILPENLSQFLDSLNEKNKNRYQKIEELEDLEDLNNYKENERGSLLMIVTNNEGKFKISEISKNLFKIEDEENKNSIKIKYKESEFFVVLEEPLKEDSYNNDIELEEEFEEEFEEDIEQELENVSYEKVKNKEMISFLSIFQDLIDKENLIVEKESEIKSELYCEEEMDELNI